MPTNGPLIVQSDRTVLLEVAHPDAEDARHDLAVFAELERAPEHIHTYRITRLGLWNARAAGHTAADMLATLEKYSKFAIPQSVVVDMTETVGRYGRLVIERADDGALTLTETDAAVLSEITRARKVAALLFEKRGDHTYVVQAWARGQLKQELLKLGWPAEDLAGYTPGTPHEIALDESAWHLRPYQHQAIDNFAAHGSGVVVLPCGAGKTLVGLGAMAAGNTTTLILVTNTVSARQWKAELLDKTTLAADSVGEYTGNAKEVRPITIATYQIITHRRSKDDEFTHFALFDERNWGLIIYDEVHLLPAPVFQITASLQARRRLGLTATLVREDGKEDDVFALIGPKKYDVPWKEMEKQGWIATATCTEIRLPMTEPRRMEYAVAEARHKFRIASENPGKLRIVRALLERHRDVPVLIIGMYVEQVEGFARELGLPLLTGGTSQAKRDVVYEQFRRGEIRALVVSKIANFSVDLPDAAVAIQVSGMFGSRQEEAQRLGRVLRPKP
ncbi:MAG: DEAD/DEAH box helicase, partial [Verrucomicrobia bacterium]|nr:DEAD/DEAH box helicase [Verrucomicrobiota bacterium]